MPAPQGRASRDQAGEGTAGTIGHAQSSTGGFAQPVLPGLQARHICISIDKTQFAETSQHHTQTRAGVGSGDTGMMAPGLQTTMSHVPGVRRAETDRMGAWAGSMSVSGERGLLKDLGELPGMKAQGEKLRQPRMGGEQWGLRGACWSLEPI